MNYIIVHEQDTAWSTGIRRSLPRADEFAVIRVPTTTAARELLHSDPTSVLISEAACGSEEFLCEILPNLKSDYPEAVFIVATHDDDPTHSAYYESGATLVATCPWKPEPITQLICKHFARQPPKPETTREKIWNALPWQATHTDH